MAKQRKAPITSKAEQVRIMAAAGKEILPPSHVALDKGDMPFFHSIIAEFAKADWTDHQIELAAMMARLMADTEREHIALRAEGSIVRNQRGTQIMNPRRSIIQMNAQSILNMRRTLSLNAIARGSKDQRANNARLAKETEEDNPLAPESLLAIPGNMNRQSYNKQAA